MSKPLNNKKVAILTESGFEQSELAEPKKALEDAGAEVVILSPEKDEVRSWHKGDWGDLRLKVDKKVKDAQPEDYDALLIPGGVINPDQLRRNKEAIQFTTDFFKTGKTLASICHGPQMLIETGLLKGKKMTSFFSIKTDLINAGVQWEDKEVVTDGNLITSRNPDDIPAFNKKIIETLSH